MLCNGVVILVAGQSMQCVCARVVLFRAVMDNHIRATGPAQGLDAGRQLRHVGAAGRKLEGHGVVVGVAATGAREGANGQDQRVAGAGGGFEDFVAQGGVGMHESEIAAGRSDSQGRGGRRVQARACLDVSLSLSLCLCLCLCLSPPTGHEGPSKKGALTPHCGMTVH